MSMSSSFFLYCGKYDVLWMYHCLFILPFAYLNCFQFLTVGNKTTEMCETSSLCTCFIDRSYVSKEMYDYKLVYKLKLVLKLLLFMYPSV